MNTTTLVALPFALGLLIALPGAAQAEPAPGDFGQHVSSCAQTMGLSGDHNPGVHRGAHDWDGMPC
ncbi:hypothetical protein NPS01_17770 [Nocardioides psychrotolerans]|uniref:Excalibur calcium-binding domain-containing protein n=1 Tax=Nocardioides psychrotolerans TaxID=1005945 RepID=A0A1I3IS20_9ACTN|nr:hypothetical protein [Nocardioides psychrotolerans]GEP38114.1 hypothetical protein NPS01_17770 [Nocardioides psychrotolerans]SFI50786.1 hypothetical protein SAMN05216561_109127 [Nocardioides psychrotolerans]